MGQAPLRDEARQPGEQAQVQGHRRRHRPRRRRRPRPRWPSSGYNVKCFCYQDSPRRAHSIAAQGGINAAKNYQNDGDSVYRLFYDTVKGGDFRSREANVYRLAQVSRRTSSTSASRRACPSPASTAACSPTAPSAARRSRARSTRAARPASSSCSAPTRRSSARSALGTVTMYPRHEMLDLVVVDGRARGIVDARPGHRRDRVARRPTPSSSRPAATATSSTSRPTPRAATPRRSGAPTSKGAAFANPCFTQIHPTCIPVTGEYQSKLTLMSESLRNDGRIWVPKAKGDQRAAERDPRGRARLLPRAHVPELRQPGAARHRLARRQAASATRAAASGRAGSASTSTSRDAIERLGEDGDRARSTATSSRCTSASPARTRTRCRCASTPPSHYTMGGLWVDYNLMTHDPRPLRRSARRTSPTTAPTASAPARSCRASPTATSSSRTRSATTSRDDEARQGPTRRTPTFEDGRGGRRRTGPTRLLVDQGQAHRRLVPPRARQDHVGPLRHGAQPRRASSTALQQDPGPARGVLEERHGPRRRRGAQPVAREGRPRRRLPRARRADVPRRARRARSPAAATSARSTRRRTARPSATTSTSATSPPGSTRARAGSPIRTRSRSTFENVHLAQRSYK